MRIYRRRDGTVLTADCPVGRLRRLRNHARRAVVAAASWFGISVVGGCRDAFVTQGEVCPPTRATNGRQEVDEDGTPLKMRYGTAMGTPALLSTKPTSAKP